MLKIVLTVLAGILLTALFAGAALFYLMSYKDSTYVSSAPYSPAGRSNPSAAVIYYSRSGHSEAVAREVARRLNAPIARINASYPLSLSGQKKAITDAEAGDLPHITVEPIDLRPARRIYLVSPTWMFRPATPLWAWVAQNDLSGREIVLITTGNSRYRQTETDEFARVVTQQGGQFITHIFLRRGRIFWQKSREELLNDTRLKMDLLLREKKAP
ncbi:flavodoxin/nitric oxide synthase [Pantoea sp. B9002]|nr:flavodoxin/nitric oxide synthase [Pantoea sp. B9002]